MKTERLPTKAAVSEDSQPDWASELLLRTILVANLPASQRARLTRKWLEWQVRQLSTERLLTTALTEMQNQPEPDDAVHLVKCGAFGIEYRFIFPDDKQETGNARAADTKARVTDTLGDALLAGFSKAVRTAVRKAHNARLAVPGREGDKPVERRPSGPTTEIDDRAVWSPESWKSLTQGH
jgi:hypothetical protein